MSLGQYIISSAESVGFRLKRTLREMKGMNRAKLAGWQ